MKTDLKLSQVVRMHKELIDLQKEHLPIKTKYKISKLFNAVNSENLIFEDLRNKLIDKHGEDQNKGIPDSVPNYQIHPNSKNWSEFIKDIDELTSQTVSIEYLSINLSDIEDLKTDKPYHEIFSLINDDTEN